VPQIVKTESTQSRVFESLAKVARVQVVRVHSLSFSWVENQFISKELKIDSFEADRAPASIDASGGPVHGYRTMNLAGIFVRERGLFMSPQNAGRFYHDGRFGTLLDVVNSYDARFDLGLTPQEKQDLVEYLKSL
jgi:hypothetical protein